MNQQYVDEVKRRLESGFLECAYESESDSNPLRVFPARLPKGLGECEVLNDLYVILNGVTIAYLRQMVVMRKERVLILGHWGLAPELCNNKIGPSLLKGLGLAINKAYGITWIDFSDEPNNPGYIRFYVVHGAIQQPRADRFNQLFWRWKI